MDVGVREKEVPPALSYGQAHLRDSGAKFRSNFAEA